MKRIAITENGAVEGLPAADPRITSYKGIPFAAPPVGANRWRAPQPCANWDGVWQAYTFAPISMQAPTVIDKSNIYTREWAVDPDIIMNEDCLYLNVWAPAEDHEELLPVFVWYFGGGLQVGHTAEMEFDGERIARRGIVVVTINYRLNAFGFLCHPEITAEAPEAPANFGHLDQQFATRWVERNIAAFGGDSKRITIGGQSAGGASVLAQIACAKNEGLFQSAIIQSGLFRKLYPTKTSPLDQLRLSDAERKGQDFFAFLGVSTLAEARAMDSEMLNCKALEYQAFWGTVIDGQFLLKDTFDTLISGEGCPVALLTGRTSEEFFTRPAVESLAEFETMAGELFGDEADCFMELCRGNMLEESLDKASLPGIAYATRLANYYLNKHHPDHPMFCYIFDSDIPGWDHPGTFHSVDLWFFFETLAKCWRPFVGRHYDLARQMCDYWCNFIRHGNPNGAGTAEAQLPLWEPLTPTMQRAMLFGEGSHLIDATSSELMDFVVDCSIIANKV